MKTQKRQIFIIHILCLRANVTTRLQFEYSNQHASLQIF